MSSLRGRAAAVHFDDKTATLYSSLIPGRGIPKPTQFAQQAFASLHETMQAGGFVDRFDTHIAPYHGHCTLSKALNRQVIGSMNDLVRCAKGFLEQEHTPLQKVEHFLNNMPSAVLDYAYPREAFAALPVA